jgi:hypothetical protein
MIVLTIGIKLWLSEKENKKNNILGIKKNKGRAKNTRCWLWDIEI